MLLETPYCSSKSKRQEDMRCESYHVAVMLHYDGWLY